jgi:hypothetical protein
MSAELSDLEKAVADSEKSTAALIARANELANKAPLQTGDPLDSNDLVSNELGINTPKDKNGQGSMPVTTKSDTSINVGTAAIILLAAFIIYKIIR